MLAWPPREHRSVRRVRSWTRRRLWPKAARGDQTSCLVMDSPSALRTATGSASSCTGAATWAGVTVSLFYVFFHGSLLYQRSASLSLSSLNIRRWRARCECSSISSQSDHISSEGRAEQYIWTNHYKRYNMSHYERLCKGWLSPQRNRFYFICPSTSNSHFPVLLVFTATISVKLHQLYLAQPILNRRQTFKDPFIWIDYMVQTMEAEMLKRVIGCFSPWLLNLLCLLLFSKAVHEVWGYRLWIFKSIPPLCLLYILMCLNDKAEKHKSLYLNFQYIHLFKW